MSAEIEIRECTTIAELDACVQLQKLVFGLPDLEISPRRHLIVSRRTGGWTLGAFCRRKLVGFVHHLVAVRGGNEIIGYSHMMAVVADYQDRGIGARLKWAQRQRALAEGRRYITWTWEPLRGRNGHFNLNRLGATAETYAENLYGTDYVTDPEEKIEGARGIYSDRIFASWDLGSERVTDLARGRQPPPLGSPVLTIEIPPNWPFFLKEDLDAAREEQLRVRAEFRHAFSAGLVCAGFDRDATRPRYLFYERGRLRRL
jgi:predicted GNAT superfamily acetyltransferase